MTSLSVLRALTLSLTAATALAQGPCSARGITLQAGGGRLGDAWSVRLTGTAGTLGVLGFDLQPGPTATPIGTVCLGLTPLLATTWFVFDSVGLAAAGGVLPPNANLVGQDFHVAAIGLDPAQPGGFAFSNGGSIAPRQPRFFLVGPGTNTPFGTTPGSIAAVNGITADVAWNRPLASSVRDAIFVGEAGWLVLLLGNGTLAAFDGRSGTPTLSLPLTGAAATATRLLAAPGGGLLFLMAPGTPATPFGGGTPGSLHVLTLPTGTPLASVPLAFGNPDAMLHLPGTTTVLLRLPDALVPVDFITGQVQAAIPMPAGYGSLADWQLVGGTLYCLHAGQTPNPLGGTGLPAGVTAVDPQTGILRWTIQLTQPAPVTILRHGPGAQGPALFALGSSTGTIETIALVTSLPAGSVTLGAGVAAMELSSLGTSWLLVCTGAGCGGPTLLTMPAATLVAVPAAALPAGAQSALAVSPTVAWDRACLAAGNSTAWLFRTDPFQPPVPVALPVAAGAFRVVSDW